MFERYAIELVMISMDTVEQAALMRKRDSLWCRLLADPKLAVIRQYGLVNRSPIAKTFWVFGLPVGMVLGFRDMAIPTGLIIDEHGVVRWIDQSDDYRIRADRSRVEAAIAEVFQPVESAETSGMQTG